MFVSVDIKAQEQKRIVYSDVLKTLEEHTCLECHSTNKKEAYSATIISLAKSAGIGISSKQRRYK